MVKRFSLFLDHLVDKSMKFRNGIEKVPRWSLRPKFLVPIAFADLFGAFIKVRVFAAIIKTELFIKARYPARKDVPRHLLHKVMRQAFKISMNIFRNLSKFLLFKIVVLLESESTHDIDAGVHENFSRIHAFRRGP